MEKQEASWWSRLKKSFFQTTDTLEEAKGMIREPKFYESLVRCYICNFTEAFEVVEEYDPDGRLAWRRLHYETECLTQNKGWQKLWVVGGNDVCPSCVAKMKRAIVPGFGIELVPEAMIKEGRAFLTSDFTEQESDNEAQK